MRTEIFYKQLGRRIKDRREALGFTQEVLAGKLGISRASFANIEVGRQRLLVHQLYEIAKALGSDFDELLAGQFNLNEQELVPEIEIPQGIDEKFHSDIRKLLR